MIEFQDLSSWQRATLGAGEDGNLTDHEGHAQCMAAIFPNSFRYIPTHGWLYYDGKCWTSELAEAAVDRAITRVLRLRRMVFAGWDDPNMTLIKDCAAKRANIVNTKAQFANIKGVVSNIGWFNKSKDHININDGVLDLRTGEIEPHNPKQLYTYCLNINYRNNKNELREWLAFIESTGNGGEMLDYLQMALGYTLTGHTREEVMFYLYGERRSGKGTFTETITKMMGDLAAGVDMSMFTDKRYGNTSNFDLAPLEHKRMIAAGESDRRGLQPTTIKKLTGGDAIYCSHKGKPHFSFYPSFKLWLTSNHSLNMDVEDDAAWGRARVIHMKNSFYGKENKSLKLRFSKQNYLDAVFWWCVQGAIKWYQTESTGLPLPKQVEEATQRQRDEMDSVTQFLESSCTVDLEMVETSGILKLFTEGKTLYNAYKWWCDDEGYSAFGRRRFTTNLAARGIESKPKWDKEKDKAVRGYLGVKLGEDLSEVEEEIPI